MAEKSKIEWSHYRPHTEQIEAAQKSIVSWPEWMKSAAVFHGRKDGN